MPKIIDGPVSPLFRSVPLQGNISPGELAGADMSAAMIENIQMAPRGPCVHWGLPFQSDNWLLAKTQPVSIDLRGQKARWLVFSHASDLCVDNRTVENFVTLGGGKVRLLGPATNTHEADYIFCYEDGTKERVAIKGMCQIGPFMSRLDENCSLAVTHMKDMLTRSAQVDQGRFGLWGYAQTQSFTPDVLRQWVNWLWAWENPHPDKALASITIEPVDGAALIFALTAGDVAAIPLRWRQRRKAVLKLPESISYNPSLEGHATVGIPFEEVVGGSSHVKLDMGQIISVQPRPLYPNENWPDTKNNELPEMAAQEVLVEYAAHPDAHFHLADGSLISVQKLEDKNTAGSMRVIPPARRKVRVRIIDARTKRKVAAKLHIHGESGEYLPPTDHNRIPNAHWFQDFGGDYVHKSRHFCSYIDGETEVLLPEGRVFIEVSKGFEVAPVRQVIEVDSKTDELTIELSKALDWRARGWVTADTHVHFLSPQTALLEGAAEGVNIVNLLVSQWGEMFTNVGDFDGKTTFGARENGGSGEYLVRVGSENRQGFLGHISLLGYEDELIRPLSAGGPAESAIGDPLNVLLTDWAQKCKTQKGTVIIPHFPLPRAEHAATIIAGLADAMELTSLGAQAQGGFSPYAIVDWYRYLNCGYFIAAVGGTDKMSAATAVGAGRTYARLNEGEILSYRAWQDAVERGQTFVTFGPLVDMSVEEKPPGARIAMSASGGTVDVVWRAESIMIPMSRAELIVNGEVRESITIDPRTASGHWRVKVEKSSWIAILVRGREPGQEEVVSAHTSPVMIAVEGSEFMAAADALSILEQVEGSLAYLDTLGTRADTATFKKMKLTLTSVHNQLHSRLHAIGVEHDCALIIDENTTKN